MAIERRGGQLQRPGLAGLVLAGIGAIVVVLVAVAVLKTIFWLIEVAFVVAVVIGLLVLVARLTSPRRR